MFECEYECIGLSNVDVREHTDFLKMNKLIVYIL